MTAETLTRHPDVAALAGDLIVPIGAQVPIKPGQMPASGYLEVLRYVELPEWPHVIPKVLPEGHVILYGLPGAGKSRLAIQWAHCTAYRRPWAGYTPDEPGRVLYVDFENQAEGIKRASEQIDPFGELETDALGIDEAATRRLVRIAEPFKGECFDDRLLELRELLDTASAAGELPRLVIVDTLQQFCFPYPDTNSQRWEKRCSLMLDALALEYRVCLLSVHHANKVGELSGSTGLAGGATAVFKVRREKGSTDGALICDGKNRAGADSLCLKGQFTGRWDMTDDVIEVTPGEVECPPGERRDVLDWLRRNGPADVEAIRAGCPQVNPRYVSQYLSRLRKPGFVVQLDGGLWAAATSQGNAVRACAGIDPATGRVCGKLMTVCEAGQTTHVNCVEPAPPRPGLPFGPGVPGDYWTRGDVEDQDQDDDEGGPLAEVVQLPVRGADVELPGVVELPDAEFAHAVGESEAGNSSTPWRNSDDEDQAADEDCPVCGLLILPDYPHDDCADTGETRGPRWPAQQELNNSIKAIRAPLPVKFIAREGDQLGQGDGRQHRGMPQWQAAVQADKTMTGYSSRWRPAGLLDTYGPDRLVITLDKVQAYVSACENVPVCPALLDHTGPLDVDPRDLGAPNPRRARGAEGLAGVVLVECPAWDHPGLPHPLGLHARPGELMWLPSNMLHTLWKLHGDGLIARPVVADSFMGPLHSGVFKKFAVAVKEARAAAGHGTPLDASVKLGSSIAISRMRSPDKGKGVYRPDQHAAICAESMIRLWAPARGAIAAGEVLAGLGAVDECSWLLPEGADPDTWLPAGYKLGDTWGCYRHKPVSFRRGRVDLSAVDPARVTPSPTTDKRVRVSGALPLGLWVQRA